MQSTSVFIIPIDQCIEWLSNTDRWSGESKNKDSKSFPPVHCTPLTLTFQRAPRMVRALYPYNSSRFTQRNSSVLIRHTTKIGRVCQMPFVKSITITRLAFHTRRLTVTHTTWSFPNMEIRCTTGSINSLLKTSTCLPKRRSPLPSQLVRATILCIRARRGIDF